MVTQESCWRQVLLLPPSPRCRLGRTPGHTSSAVTSTGSANCKLTGHRQMRSDKGPSAQAQPPAVRAKQPRGVRSRQRREGGLGSRGGRGGECTQEREFHSDAWYLLGGNSTLQEQWAGVCALSCLGLKRNSPSAEKNSRGGIQSL